MWQKSPGDDSALRDLCWPATAAAGITGTEVDIDPDKPSLGERRRYGR